MTTRSAVRLLCFLSATFSNLPVVAQKSFDISSTLVSNNQFNYEIVATTTSPGSDSAWILAANSSQDNLLELWEISFDGDILKTVNLDFPTGDINFSGLETRPIELNFLSENELVISKIDQARTLLAISYNLNSESVTNLFQYTPLHPRETIVFHEPSSTNSFSIISELLNPIYRDISISGQVLRELELTQLNKFNVTSCFYELSDNSFLLCGIGQETSSEGRNQISFIKVSNDGDLLHSQVFPGISVYIEKTIGDMFIVNFSENIGIFSKPDAIYEMNESLDLLDISERIPMTDRNSNFSVVSTSNQEFYIYPSSSLGSRFITDLISINFYKKDTETLISHAHSYEGNFASINYNGVVDAYLSSNRILIIANLEFLEGRSIRKGIELISFSIQ